MSISKTTKTSARFILIALATTFLIHLCSDIFMHEGMRIEAQELNQNISSDVPVEQAKVITSHPHDAEAFTQGLVYDPDEAVFYESTGLIGSSSLRKVEVATGKVLKSVSQLPPIFSEGLAMVGDTLIQLTWTNQKAFVYDKRSFSLIREFSYEGEGWGLAYDDKYLIFSDGTATIKFVDPSTFKTVRSIQVKDNGKSVSELNELEYINGEIYANIWKSNRIVRINPATGAVNSYIDLTGIHTFSGIPSSDDVLNGIAWDSANERLYVTGKRWDKVYSIEIEKASTGVVNGRVPTASGGSGSPSAPSSSGGGGCLMGRFSGLNQ